LVAPGSFSMEVVPFTTVEATGVLSRPSVPVGRLSACPRRTGSSVGSASSSETTGARSLLVTDTSSAPGWLLEESALRKGIRDVRFLSFFVFSANVVGGAAVFFLLPITVPRRLFKPCFFGASLDSETSSVPLRGVREKHTHQ
jgi:hypothetical protein